MLIRRRAHQAIARLAPLIVALVLWQWLCGSSPERRFFFSSPIDVLRVLWNRTADGSLISNAAITASEALVGFLLGNGLGALLGLMLWIWRPVATIAKPYLVVLGAIPVFAIAPMTVIWFGVGYKAKVMLAFLATVFVAAHQAYRGAEQVDPLLVDRLKVFGATRTAVFRILLVPASAAWVLSSLRLTGGLALLGAFVGEFIAAEKGLGYFIVRAGSIYDSAGVLAGVIAIVLLALSLDYGVDVAQRKLIRW